MAFSQTITEQWSGDGRSITKSNTYSGDGQFSREVTVADSETDYLIACVLDVSEIEAIYINSTQDVTLETNNGGAPDDTISLTANKPYVWTSDSYLTNVLDTDITAIYITNASGASATVSIECVFDSTV